MSFEGGLPARGRVEEKRGCKSLLSFCVASPFATTSGVSTPDRNTAVEWLDWLRHACARGMDDKGRGESLEDSSPGRASCDARGGGGMSVLEQWLDGFEQECGEGSGR